jgi:hypothetical protein
MLLFGAGLFVRTLVRLQTEEIGFRRDNLLLFDLDARQNGYDAPSAQLGVCRSAPPASGE